MSFWQVRWWSGDGSHVFSSLPDAIQYVRNWPNRECTMVEVADDLKVVRQFDLPKTK